MTRLSLAIVLVTTAHAKKYSECIGSCQGHSNLPRAPSLLQVLSLQGKFGTGNADSSGNIDRLFDSSGVDSGSLSVPWSAGCILAGGFDFGHGCTYAGAVLSIPMCEEGAGEEPIACITERMSDRVTSYTSDVQNTSDFSKLLDVTTTAEGGGFGVTVSASVGVLTKSEITTSSMAYVLGASGEVKTTSIKNPVALQLSDAAADLLAKDPHGFLDRYSPNYVYSVIHGGSFLGTVTLNSRQTSDTSAIKFGLGFSVNAGFFTAGISTDFTREVEERKKDVKIKVSANWLGGTGVESPSESTPQSLAAGYKQWSDTWRQNPHELKIVLRKWADIEQVQAIINNHSKEVQRLFYTDTLKPTTQRMLSQESGLAHLVQTSLTRALDWREVKSNRTLQDAYHALQLNVHRHILALEGLDNVAALQLQGQVAAGNTSWFVALEQLRLFEDMRRELGRHCMDGSHLVEGLCIPWAGTCAHGNLLPELSRTDDNQCGNCSEGYALVDHECVEFALQDEHGVKMWNHDRNTRTITDVVDGYLCALQEVAVEELALPNDWSAAWCKIRPKNGRWQMHAEASGDNTDVGCVSRCIKTAYPISDVQYVSRNMDRQLGNSGITPRVLVPTGGSICWLSMASFWQASAANEWAECTVRHNSAGDTWELQALVQQRHSRTGAGCGAVCLSELPQQSFVIADEVVKQWDHQGCIETELGDVDNHHCLLTSMAVSNARDNSQRPKCKVSVKETSEGRKWTLNTCNGPKWGSKTLCGVRCVSFTRSSADVPFY